MKTVVPCLLLSLLSPLLRPSGVAQEKPSLAAGQKAVTVPAVIDHGRVIIEVEVQFPDGRSEHVRAWVDNGNPDLIISRRLAGMAGQGAICEWQTCGTNAPAGIVIGGMEIPFLPAKSAGATFGFNRDHPDAPVFPGMDAEMNIPSTVLRNYDVLIDFPGHKLTIGEPGTIVFHGESVKVAVGANGLIQVPGKIENKKYDLVLDLGSNISFLSSDLFEKFATAHADWPHMTGAVGAANTSGAAGVGLWGDADEAQWKLMRLDRVQYGPLFLTNVPVAELPTNKLASFATLTSHPVAGLVGSEALLNYRVGLDYAHSLVYFDIGRLFNFPDFDVIGLVLRADDDRGFTVLGVADLEGKPSVPNGPDGGQAGDRLVAVDGVPVKGATMGQVWMALGGTPGQERLLTLERRGRQFKVTANVQHFLAEAPDEPKEKKKK
jgi:hypothetical protein